MDTLETLTDADIIILLNEGCPICWDNEMAKLETLETEHGNWVCGLDEGCPICWDNE